MPRIATDYSKMLMYKIVCKDTTITDCYVGHTTNMKNRKGVHKHDCHSDDTKEAKVYEVINSNGGWDNWSMLEIEKYPCKDHNEARAREHELYGVLNATLNTISPMFISYDNQNLNDIHGDTAVDTNRMKVQFRQKKLKEELVFLRKEVKRLNEIINNAVNNPDVVK